MHAAVATAEYAAMHIFLSQCSKTFDIHSNYYFQWPHIRWCNGILTRFYISHIYTIHIIHMDWLIHLQNRLCKVNLKINFLQTIWLRTLNTVSIDPHSSLSLLVHSLSCFAWWLCNRFATNIAQVLAYLMKHAIVLLFNFIIEFNWT